MIVISLDPVAFSLFGFPIYWYSLLFVSGLMFSSHYGLYLLRRLIGSCDVETADLLTGFWDALRDGMILALVVGARLGEALFYTPGLYLADPWELLRLWHGGLSSHGAALGCLVAFGILTRFKAHMMEKLSITPKVLFDILLMVAPLAACFIRVGNFINGELAGTPTNLPWGVVWDHSASQVPVHPVQLYEALTYGTIFLASYAIVYTSKPSSLLYQRVAFCDLLLMLLLRVLLEFWKARLGPGAGQGYQEGWFSLTQGLSLILLCLLLAARYLLSTTFKTKSQGHSSG